MNYADILHFWFDELEVNQWFVKDPELDLQIRQRFTDIHLKAARGELFRWREEPDGRVAEILVLDQFSRNMFRDSAFSFAFDGLALLLAQEAVHSGDDREVPIEVRSFVYMPYMHSESRLIQEESMRLFSQPGFAANLEFAQRHKAIVDRFGRFPHRNSILKRQSTPEELQFLQEPGSSF